jgi:hypothetical protein
MKITRRQLRSIIKEEAKLVAKGAKGLDLMSIYNKLTNISAELQGVNATPVQKGCGLILDKLASVATGNGSYDDIIKSIELVKKQPGYQKK